MSRGDLTEGEWRVLKDLLPIEPENRGRGRRPEQNRSIINGILGRLRCGAPWRDVPPKYGSWNVIYRRFRRWSEAGIWETVAVTLPEIMVGADYSGAPFSGVICVFGAKRADRIKLIWWDGTGLCLMAKKLEQGGFKRPGIQDGVMRVTAVQLGALLEGRVQPTTVAVWPFSRLAV